MQSLCVSAVRLTLDVAWDRRVPSHYAQIFRDLLDTFEGTIIGLSIAELLEDAEETVRPLPDWTHDEIAELAKGSIQEILAFYADRLKVQLRDEGKRHDLVDAVFALGDDDLVRIVARVEALDGFLKTEDGKNLLAGYKRAANILKAEAKKNAAEAEGYAAPVDPALFAAPEEKALFAALEAAAPKVATELGAERFETAMAALSQLRGPVDDFFDRVLVNADDAAVRQNRLRLLSAVQVAMGQVADFSLVAG